MGPYVLTGHHWPNPLPQHSIRLEPLPRDRRFRCVARIRAQMNLMTLLDAKAQVLQLPFPVVVYHFQSMVDAPSYLSGSSDFLPLRSSDGLNSNPDFPS